MDKARNNRLLKTYGITEEEYEAILESQAGVCRVCRRPPKTKSLSVEHDHGIPHTKISLTRVGKAWRGVAFVGTQAYSALSEKRSDALRMVKRMLLKASVRGLLCHRCNRGLQMFSDSPSRLEAAAEYLREFYGKFYRYGDFELN